jgi:release factor glutamine methyltransferase
MTMTSGGPSISELLTRAATHFREAGIEEPRREARWLLQHLLEIPSADLIAHPERTVDPAQAERYVQAAQRRAAHEPFDYIVGERDFWGQTFTVDRRVLIPREDSESLIVEALNYGHDPTRPNAGAPTIVDVGTGSGALACTLAREMDGATVIGCDVSADALAVARCNRDRLGLRDRLHLVRGSLLCWLGQPVDLVVANLPYIPTARIPTLMPEVSNWEPHLALDGGADGLDLVRDLLADATRVVRPGGMILLELDPEQMAPARALMPAARSSVATFDGLDRVLRLDLPK